MDGFGGLVFFFGAQLRVAVLDVLADQDEGGEKKLGNVGEKEQESEGIWINRLFDNELPDDPERNYQENGVDGVHGADGGSYGYGHFIVEVKAPFVLEIDVFRGAAAFEVYG